MLRILASVAACISTVYGQTAGGQQFEVASVKLSNAAPNFSSGIRTGHGRLDGHNVTLKRCIMGAYGVGPHQVAGGPDWIETDRFEITAKADRPINDDAIFMLMLQTLLAERFKLVLHEETRTMPAYVLEVAKNGPKLEKTTEGESNTNTSNNKLGTTINARYTDMATFARVLAREAELPVVNQTGLQGIFNFKLHWVKEPTQPAGGEPAGPSLFTALQEQLGLRLRSQKAPIKTLIIDQVEKPSEN
jgi:uncharacterized protein (TIGR03435 family)